MTPEQWEEVKSLFEAALERPEARDALIGEAADPEVQRELRSLLAAHRDDGFLAEGSGLRTALAVTDASSQIGRRVGAYRIVRPLGEGGMGVVFLAARDDDAYEKQVAIKFVNAAGLSESAKRRFRHERQIVATLDHPGIAKLLDGGTTDDGVPYFVLEYVDGVPIDQWCERNDLPMSERLRLFRQVCSAVAHAHASGVIHRDLKPTNILVTRDGTPRLLDFGIAKTIDADGEPAERTATIASMMTPEYASPEQMRREAVTPASDVYALGVLLYRLLTRRSPYRVDTPLAHDLARAICEQDPAPPSAVADLRLKRRVRGDLDAIILKALEKDPARRYQSVEDLSDDIDRHLNGRPVLARRHAAASRAAKFIKRNVYAAAAVLMALATVTVLATTLLKRPASNPSPAAGSAIRSLAVLPITNLSRDPDQEYFADGMTEALITDLSKVARLRVASRTSVMRYKGTKKSLPEIGRELNVDGIIEASVLRSDGRMRIIAQLVRPATDEHVWGRTYERDVRDVLAIQADIAGAVAGEVATSLTPADGADLRASATRYRQPGRRAVDPDAYDEYVRGRYFWNKRTTDDLKRATEHFQRSIQRDPGYALAYSGLADTFFYRGYAFGDMRAADAMPRAEEAAATALRLDDSLAEAHTSMALVKFFYHWDWAAAEAQFRRALTLDPNYPTAHHGYAVFLWTVHGRGAEAVAEARRAQELDPVSVPLNNIVALLSLQSSRFDAAIEWSNKLLELDPGNRGAYHYLATAYERTGQPDRALAATLRAGSLDGARADEARRAFATGGMTAVHRLLDDAEIRAAEQTPPTSDFARYNLAWTHVELGRLDEAYRLFDQLQRDRYGMLVWVKHELLAERLRADPRFQSLLHQIGFPD